MSVYDLGLEGEKLALAYLKEKCFKLIAQRYRFGSGEIDLIMKDREVLVFIEVKHRKRGAAGEGLIAITKDKQKRIRCAALGYMMQIKQVDIPIRFDVVEISADGIIHIENAF